MLAQEIEKRNMVIILDGLDFTWREWELEEAAQMWQNGIPFEVMVDKLRPHITDSAYYRGYNDRADEVAMLLIHLGREGKIERRPGGVLA
jgi:hypothetical protein